MVVPSMHVGCVCDVCLLCEPSKSAVVAHKYSTTIKNTKPTPINLIIADVFPSSSDARIKVSALAMSLATAALGEYVCALWRGG